MRETKDAFMVDTQTVNATVKDGVLAVKLPKTPAAKGTAIPVKAA